MICQDGVRQDGVLGAEEFGVFDVVGEIVFIEVEAGGPFLALAVAEVFHQVCRGVAEPKRDRLVRGFPREF